MEDLLGRVVFSKAGRDKGNAFVVIGILDHEYLWIADGALRKLDKPKKKKLKHLTFSRLWIADISSKLKENVKIFDTEIRKALEVLQRNL